MLERIPAALPPLDGLDALLADIGSGANGFGGTPVETGDATAPASIAVIEANDGVRDRDRFRSATGGPCLRYWFELRP